MAAACWLYDQIFGWVSGRACLVHKSIMQQETKNVPARFRPLWSENKDYDPLTKCYVTGRSMAIPFNGALFFV